MSMLEVATAAAASSASWSTVTKDIATVVALSAGGLFTYFKFIKGRVLGPRASLRLQAHLLSPHPRPARLRASPPRVRGRAIGIELCIQNSGQIPLRLPSNTELLLAISSVPADRAFGTTDLTQLALSWKDADAYFASANLMLDEGQEPANDVTIEPSEDARFVGLFPIPSSHSAAAFLVVVNCRIAYRSWFKTGERWWDSRILVLPETSTPTSTKTEVN